MGKKPSRKRQGEISVKSGTKSSTIDGAVWAEILRLRSEIEELKGQRYSHGEINSLLLDLGELRCRTGGAFHVREPKRKTKWVYTFGFPGESLIIMVERPHGNRDAIPQIWRSKQMNSAKEVMDRIEAEVKEEE